MKQVIFLLEDDVDVANVLARALENHDFAVEHFPRLQDLIRRLKNAANPALFLVDLGLPDGDGMSIIGSLMRDATTPVIIISGRGDLADRVIGLELGADDYLVKPIEPRELVARVKTVLRRSQMRAAPKANGARRVARFNNWSVDFSACTLEFDNGETVSLSVAEASLLRAFLEAPGRILTRSTLLDMRNEDDFEPYDRSIDVRISRLRRKLLDDWKHPKIIKTVYGAGYVFVCDVDWQ